MTNILLEISQETDVSKLHQMNAAIRDRIDSLARLKSYSLKVGDKIKFADTIRPSYMRGLTATVVDVKRKSVSVSCPKDPRYGRFSGHSRVRLPMSLIAM